MAAIVVEGVSKKFRMYRDRSHSLKQTILQRDVRRLKGEGAVPHHADND